MKELVNGNTMQILLWAVNALLGVVIALLGLLRKMDNAAIERFREDNQRTLTRMDKEIDMLRERTHQLGDKLSGLMATDFLRRRDDVRK